MYKFNPFCVNLRNLYLEVFYSEIFHWKLY